MGIDGLDSLKPGDDDIAPDTDEPGDELPIELEEHITDAPIVPDEVDQKEVQP